MASSDRSENIFSFFPLSFPLAKEVEILSWQRFLVFLSCHFFFSFSPDVVGYFVKIIRNNQKLDIVLTLATYKNQWEVSQSEIKRSSFSSVAHNKDEPTTTIT